MPPRDSRSDLIRIVRGLRGRVPMRMELVLRFDYGLTVPWVTRGAGADLRGVAGPHQVMLRTAVPTRGENLRTVADFEVGEGEEAVFVLTHSPSHLPPPEPADARGQLAATEAFWSDWMAACPHHGPWVPAVRRSLLTLKALTYRPTGGIVAAPTASLPEVLGGSRNWDYRFCWLRDSALLLTALTGAGFLEEAGCWRDWLVRAVAGSPNQVQIMYGVAGERLLTEVELPWLPGYAGSRPVRVGNAAAGQMQLDVQGEVIDALFQARQRGLGPSAPAWPLAQAIVGHLEEVWREPDHGIWEVRGPPRHFTHSKVMVWVAFDRMVRAVETLGLEGPVERWRRVRDEIHADVCAKGFDPGLGAFTQSYGSRSLDASLLQIPLTGFLPADDPRVHGTVAAIERDLMVDGLVERYDTKMTDDGLGPAGRGRFPRLLLLAGGGHAARRKGGRGARPVRAAARPRQRRRPARGGVRLPRAAPGRELPPGLQPRGAGQRRPGARRQGEPRPERAAAAASATAGLTRRAGIEAARRRRVVPIRP